MCNTSFFTAVDAANHVPGSRDTAERRTSRISRDFYHERAGSIAFFRSPLARGCMRVLPAAVLREVGIGTTTTIDMISGGDISNGFMGAYADLPRLALIGIFCRRSRKRSRSTIYSKTHIDFTARSCARFRGPRVVSPFKRAAIFWFSDFWREKETLVVII